jgi:antirestriction protein ArdC
VVWQVNQIADSATGGDKEEAEADKSTDVLVLGYFRVCNLERCDLPQAVLDKLAKIDMHRHDPIEATERIAHENTQHPLIQYGGSKAFSSPLPIGPPFPPPVLFATAKEFYATKVHDCLHATEHRSRLNGEIS